VSASTTLHDRTHAPRPSGIIRSDVEAARRAERALVERRYEDAEGNVRLMPDGTLIERFWKALLKSAVLMTRDDLMEADRFTWQAAGLASVLLYLDKEIDKPTCCRLTARALDQLGTIARRREFIQEALTLHESALSLRTEYGSVEEQWESNLACAIDADLLGNSENAIDSLLKAVSLGVSAKEEALVKQAIALEHLCRIYQKVRRHAEAIETVRKARRLWDEHDSTSSAVARADSLLGSALISAEVARRENGDPCEVEALKEAEALLSVAAESLAAFGRGCEADARWAKEQCDFVRRLRDDIA